MLDPKHRLFRKEALARLSSPERLDQLMPVVGPKDWLALLSLALVVAAGLTWSVFGRLPTRVMGRGVLIRTGGIVDLQSPALGRLITINVQAGDLVKKGDVIGVVAWSDKSDQVICERPGRIIEITTKVGQMVERGDRLGSIETEDQPIRLAGLVYFPVTDGGKIKPKMEIQLAPDTVKREQYGGILGTVSSVSTLPATKERAAALIGNAEDVERLLGEGPKLEVVAELKPDSSTSSGYQWSSSTGPQFKITPGTPITAGVTVDKRAPITYIFPFRN